MPTKRVNFNMASECHALLKSYCAIRRISVTDYCYELIAEDFSHACRTDPMIRQLLIAGEYPRNSKAALLKETIMQEFSNE